MLFYFVLWVIGLLLAVASRASARLRNQLTRDMSVAIGSRDGVSRSYVFRNRRVSSHAGLESDAHCTLLFQTAPEGAQIFLAPDCLAQVVNGLALKEIELKGDPTSILWFYEMVMAFVPGFVQPSHVMPDAYVKPNLQGKASDRITREPVAKALDPAWTAAVAQREKLMMWQVGEGAPVPGKSKNFKPVLDVPASAMEETNE